MTKKLHHIRTTDERRADSLRLLVHDLKNPLTVIRINAEMVRDQILDPSVRQDVIDIVEAADLADALIDGMQAYLKLERDGEDFTWFPMDAVEVLRHAVDRPALRRHVRLDLPREIQMSGDRMALEGAFTDMLVNARRLAEEGRVSVRTDEHEEDDVVIRIHHPGAAIPESLRPRFFELYGALELHQSGISGAAAGLVYARMVIDQHGGKLDFEDGVDGSTDLVVRLPR